MKVLIISQHFWPETFRINEVAISLQRLGCEITILTGQPNYPGGVTYGGYRASDIRTEWYEGCKVHRVPLVPRGKGTAVRLVCNYLSFLASASLLGPWVLRGQRFDAILVYGTSPILQAMAGVVLKHLKRARLVTWVQDLWPQSLSATGFIKNRVVLEVVGAVVGWIYRRNDLLLVQSRAFIEPVAAMGRRTPVEYHPNPGELAFSQLGKEITQQRLKLEPCFNVVFAGNLGTVQALDTVLDAAELLAGQPDIRFTLVGNGSRLAWLEQQIAFRGLSNVSLPGSFPPSAMPGIFSQASVLLLSLVKNETMSQTVPSKLQAYLASRRPVIAAIDGEAARVVSEAGAGLCSPAGDAPALAEAIARMREVEPAEREEMGRRGYRYYQTHFEPNKLAETLRERLRGMATMPTTAETSHSRRNQQ